MIIRALRRARPVAIGCVPVAQLVKGHACCDCTNSHTYHILSCSYCSIDGTIDSGFNCFLYLQLLVALRCISVKCCAAGFL